jgi:hypothetical protein
MPLARFRAAALALLFGSFPAIVSAAKPLLPAPVDRPLASPRAASAAAPTPAGPVAGTAVQFDTVPVPLPPDVPSLGFAANGAAEIGDVVRLDGAGHAIDAVTVTLSSRALRSDYPGAPAAGFNHPLTLRLHAVDRSDGTPRAGDLLATVTTTFTIPWRPEPDPLAPPPPFRPWRAADGQLYAGFAFTVTFDLSALALSLPTEVIYSLGCNTAFAGAAPLGVVGPYDALHLGFREDTPTAGADPEPDALFWKTSRASAYTDGGFVGVNTFRRDTGWAPYRPAVRLTSSTYAALAAAVADLGFLRSPDRLTQAALTESLALGTWALTKNLWDGTARLRPVLGRLVFDLLAEAAGELAAVAASRSSLAPAAQDAIDAFLAAAESLAEVAIADAVVAGGDARRLGRAQDTFDQAVLAEARQLFEKAVEDFGGAWREATLSVR